MNVGGSVDKVGAEKEVRSKERCLFSTLKQLYRHNMTKEEIMIRTKWLQGISVGVLSLALVGCENLPGEKGTQGAVIGGVTGAAVGAAVGGKEHRVLGAILGGALGSAGGYVVGANSDKIIGDDKEGAREAAQAAQADPATPQEALNSTTADLNEDGFVTLDEVVAMEQAGLGDEVIVQRLEATGQVFELTDEQQEHLISRGVSREVVLQMNEINQEKKRELLNERRDVISEPTDRRI